MKIKLIKDGSIAEVEDSWGERLIEQGKAILPPPEKAKAKVAVAVTDKVPENKAEAEAPKAEPKKAGKKR